jgi:hypothetical protein
MAMVDWIKLIEDKWITKGLSLKTDKSILNKHRIYINEMFRDLIEEYPTKRFHHMILSLKDHYDIEEIYDLLDDHNKAILMKDLVEENNLKIPKSKKNKF